MQVEINVDQFRRQRVNELVALLPSEQDAVAACDDLGRAGVAADEAEILVGPEGIRILDADGTEHGYLARAARILTHLGSAENVLHLPAELSDAIGQYFALPFDDCRPPACPEAARPAHPPALLLRCRRVRLVV